MFSNFTRIELHEWRCLPSFEDFASRNETAVFKKNLSRTRRHSSYCFFEQEMVDLLIWFVRRFSYPNHGNPQKPKSGHAEYFCNEQHRHQGDPLVLYFASCIAHKNHVIRGMRARASYYTVQLQAWHVHCPISAQIVLSISVFFKTDIERRF